MRVLVNQSTCPANFTILKASMVEFPALNGQSVSYAVLQYPTSFLNPLHTHPRAAELLFLVEESFEVGFVDTTNKLFSQSLQASDMFIFPKGLVHYQYNADPNNPAIVVSSFGSANVGTVSLPKTLFATNVDDTIWINPPKLMFLPFKLSRLVLHPSKSHFKEGVMILFFLNNLLVALLWF
ncbi:hypothetical protein J1N35_041923 [Gossypium stocksii]|uniref:Germin-like protein n=1 Tax=Gossypium stocksii TaxID=47602 RepID=A0A9D3ZJ28_9ROSI|nr:hypothetical protein J1N35_041923 [Gossypium stocksii]